jgi:hypothetical protein
VRAGSLPLPLPPFLAAFTTVEQHRRWRATHQQEHPSYRGGGCNNTRSTQQATSSPSLDGVAGVLGAGARVIHVQKQ